VVYSSAHTLTIIVKRSFCLRDVCRVSGCWVRRSTLSWVVLPLSLGLSGVQSGIESRGEVGRVETGF